MLRFGSRFLQSISIRNNGLQRSSTLRCFLQHRSTVWR